MRKAIYALMGGLIVASCIVPKYEVDDSVSDDDGGGESGTNASGGTMTGGSSSGGAAGRGGSTTGGAGRGGSPSGGDAGESGSPSGGSTNGGSAGAGMGGSGGGGMGGCAMGLTDCDGECKNLETDAEHCGDCDTSCDTGEVCFEGDCDVDCGTLTQCGTSCVDTDTDEMHCGDCDTPCLGTCVGGDCDLSCPDNRLRCGAVCCATPPANGIALCPQNQCLFGCATNYNDCNPDPAVTECYSTTDVAHCGSQCLDCRQPNATPMCTSGGACSNTCIGEALPCAPVNGKPGCGTWDFESGTTEGWSIWDRAPTEAPTAADGPLVSRTMESSTGARSLAVHFVGNGSPRLGIEFKLRLCESGQAINLGNKVLLFDVLAVTDDGGTGFVADSEGYNYFTLWNGTSEVQGDGSDFGMSSDDIWLPTSMWIPDGTPAITDIVFWFRVFKAWQGWVYIDNVRIQQCTPQLCP